MPNWLNHDSKLRFQHDGIRMEPQPVKLIVGLLAGDRVNLDLGLSRLVGRFGQPDAIMDIVPFTHTRYYEKELGPSPLRIFSSFDALIQRTQLPELKLWTCEVERELSVDGKRPVNLDPGYITLGQIFLASTKDQRQRVYVRDGIYVEPTLYFRNGKFHPFEWTYPDYRNGNYFGFLENVRDIYLGQLKKGRFDTA